jgi:hypothetical protein
MPDDAALDADNLARISMPDRDGLVRVFVARLVIKP